MREDDLREAPVTAHPIPQTNSEPPRPRALPPPNPGGDPIGRLFDEHHAHVFRIAHRICGSRDDAEDVLQTVFLRIARRPDLLDPALPPAHYLARAAVNTSLSLVKSRRLRRAEPLEEAALTVPGDRWGEPDRVQIDRETRDQLRAALGRLDPRTAQIFVLRYFEEYGNREIARIVGTSPAAVAVILFRAKGLLRKELARTMGERP